MNSDLDTIATVLVAGEDDGLDTGDAADALQALERVRASNADLLKAIDGLLELVDLSPCIAMLEDDPIDIAFTTWEKATGEPHPPLKCWGEECEAAS
jgi:hypothetical protein